MPPEISFRPVTAADLPLLGRWMQAPHWREWWGDPDTELGYIRDMVEGHDMTRPYLFELDGNPVGYIQVWFIADNRVEPWLTEAPWLEWLPDETVGVDLSIGPADLLSRGLGSAALSAFVALLRAEGHEQIIIDPDPENARALRAYRKAGFRPIPDFEGRIADSLLMRHHEKDDTP